MYGILTRTSAVHAFSSTASKAKHMYMAVLIMAPLAATSVSSSSIAAKSWAYGTLATLSTCVAWGSRDLGFGRRAAILVRKLILQPVSGVSNWATEQLSKSVWRILYIFQYLGFIFLTWTKYKVHFSSYYRLGIFGSWSVTTYNWQSNELGLRAVWSQTSLGATWVWFIAVLVRPS